MASAAFPLPPPSFSAVSHSDPSRAVSVSPRRPPSDEKKKKKKKKEKEKTKGKQNYSDGGGKSQTKLSMLRAQIGALCKEGRPEMARRLFDSIPAPIPTVLWNTLLIGYVCNSLPDEALRLYAAMVAASAPADAYTFSSALKACAELRLLPHGEAIHARLLRLPDSLLLHNTVLCNSLLNLYASSPETTAAAACRLFDRMPVRNVVSWNTMLRWAARRGRPLESLSMFKEMVEGGTEPSAVSFINVFPAAAALGDVSAAMALFGMLLKRGDELAADPFVASAAVCMLAELGDVAAARRAFDLSAAAARTTEVWNAMIGGYIQNGLNESALRLFARMLGAPVPTDAVTHVAALAASPGPRLGAQVHGRVVKSFGAAPPVVLANALMGMYARCGEVEAAALELFRRMPDRDAVSWNTIVAGRVQSGLDREALAMVREMTVEPDEVTLAAVLSAASNLGELRPGKEAHGRLLRRGIGGAAMDSYLIDMYAKGGAVGAARRLFDGAAARDLVTWNAMIAGHARAGQSEPALALFRELLRAGLPPSATTLSSVLPCCGAAGGLRSARELHGFAVRRGLDANPFVGTSLVDAYAKCGWLGGAEKVFEGMPERGVVAHTAMISGLGAHGQGRRALALFAEMRARGLSPDAATFVAAMAACAHAGLVEEGLALFRLMEGEAGVAASHEHHCCVVDMLGRAGRVREAYDFALRLGDKGRFVGIWGSLLAACRQHGELELARAAAARVFEIERGGGGAGHHVLLANALAARGRWEEVGAVRRRMRAGGVSKEPGFSDIRVGHGSHRFSARPPEDDDDEFQRPAEPPL
ncbi:pentatricopeptide repeat-containing protein At3g22150, chloroplastic-like [Wolffia australiana]